MIDTHIKTITLANYRNFKLLSQDIDQKIITIFGENGVGKTNILESISLFFPGKGLRHTKRFDEICKNNEHSWQASVLASTKMGTSLLEVDYDRIENKKTIEYNGARLRNSELSKFFNMIWLTPQMDQMFLGSISDRRKFLDRMVFNFDFNHAPHVSTYEKLMQERSKLLQSDYFDEKWCQIIEEKMAQISIKIAVSRLNSVQLMQKAIDMLDNEFPKASIWIENELEEAISNGKDNIEEYIIATLANNRHKDRITGRTSFGVHKSDFIVGHKEKNVLSKNCSTGEQKAMLISITLAQVGTIINDYNIKPIMLFDEIFVHLDDRRKAYLSEFFLACGGQVWITATDKAGIEKLSKQAQEIPL